MGFITCARGSLHRLVFLQEELPSCPCEDESSKYCTYAEDHGSCGDVDERSRALRIPYKREGEGEYNDD